MDLQAALEYQEYCRSKPHDIDVVLDCRIMSKYFQFVSGLKSAAVHRTLPSRTIEFDYLYMRYTLKPPRERGYKRRPDYIQHKMDIFDVDEQYQSHIIDSTGRNIGFSDICNKYAEKLNFLLVQRFRNYQVVGDLHFKSFDKSQGQTNMCKINVVITDRQKTI